MQRYNEADGAVGCDAPNHLSALHFCSGETEFCLFSLGFPGWHVIYFSPGFKRFSLELATCSIPTGLRLGNGPTIESLPTASSSPPFPADVK